MHALDQPCHIDRDALRGIHAAVDHVLAGHVLARNVPFQQAPPARVTIADAVRSTVPSTTTLYLAIAATVAATLLTIAAAAVLLA